MNKLRLSLMALILAAMVALPGVSQCRANAADTGVLLVTGAYKITSPIYVESGAEIVAMLADVASEVKHDADVYSTQEGIVIATAQGTTAEGTYSVQLPIRPRGPLFKLDKSAQDKQGVGVYVVTFADNFSGSDFTKNVQLPQNNATTRFDDQRQRVNGGKMLVWAPDKGEKFPSDFGSDQTLFTDDDPLMEMAQGWSMIDLDQKPFKIIRSEKATADYIESSGGLEDYSSLSYSEAWDKLFTRVSTHYPFTQLKKLDWKAIKAKIQPMIDAASTDDNFIAAIQAFTLSIPDTHVGTSRISNQSITSLIGEIGVGDMVLTDDGQVVVKYITPKGPAERAGLKAGAVITQVDGKPVLNVVNAASTVYSGASTPWFKQHQQLQFFLRGKSGSKVTLTFQNEGEDAKTVDIRRRSSQSIADVAPSQEGDPLELVVTSKILPSGVGYISIRNFFDDRTLEYRLFTRAIDRLTKANVKGIIIDDRDNAGGFSDMGTKLAGHFYKDKTLIYTRQSVDDKGAFVKRYSDFIEPQQPNYEGPVAVLVNANSVSEGDYFAYFMKRAPNAFIVGSTPTSGAGGGIQEYKLPGGIDHFQSPEYPAVDDQGKIIIEGTGVEPDVKVPVTLDDVRKGNDAVLKAAEDKILAGGK